MTAAPARKGRNGKPPVTHCKHGHLFDEKNTYTTADGKRYCRTCAVYANARSYAKTHVSATAQGTPRIRDIPHLDGSPWLDLLAAVCRQAIRDYKADGDEDAMDFLAFCGLLTRNGSIRRP